MWVILVPETGVEKYNFSMENRVLGILAGNDTPKAMLKFWGSKADILIAADRGGDHLIDAGIFPHVILGDLDSSTLDPSTVSFDMHKFDDQNYSDCDKLLAYIEGQGHSAATIIGFEGDRIDHVLASIGSFLRSPLSIRIAIRHGLAHVKKERGPSTYVAYPGQTVSLLPILPSSGVSTKGLQWELLNANLEFGSHLSLSNIAESDEISVSLEKGALLIVQEFEEARLPEW